VEFPISECGRAALILSWFDPAEQLNSDCRDRYLFASWRVMVEKNLNASSPSTYPDEGSHRDWFPGGGIKVLVFRRPNCWPDGA
jgi:hypothetical protein